MNISVHLSGCVVAYEPNTHHVKKEVPTSGRDQGSLISYQKRKIADAVEWIRQNAVHKPLIFVATSPGYTHAATEKHLIQKLTHNLRNGYGVKDYVWVRELTKMGYPHFHFVADCPWINDVVGLSTYWSSLFGSDAANSIRLGTKPVPGVKRKYYVESAAMAWYLSKYLGKGLEKERSYLAEAGFTSTKYCKTYRQFAISQRAGLMSQPMTFQGKIHFIQPDDLIETADGRLIQKPAIAMGRTFEDPTTGQYFNHKLYEWKQHPIHKVFFGMKKEVKKQMEKEIAQQNLFQI